MKKLILLLFLFLNVTAFAQTPEIEGEWTPDTDCWLGIFASSTSKETNIKYDFRHEMGSEP